VKLLLKAIILAGGRGKRLRPITDYVPKPLIPINNIPIIEWQIKYLKKFGISEVIICSGYKTEMIKKAGKKIKDKSFIVLNGDTITNIDLKKLIKKENTIAAIQLRTKFGILHTEQNKIIKFDEKKEIKDVWMNAGIYHLNRETINHLPTIGDIEKTLFPNYAKKEKLSTVKFTNVKWYSIDSFKDMEECSVVINKIIK